MINDALFTEWVKEYTKEMFNWAFKKVSDKTLAEDLVQDTFLAAYHSLATFKAESSPKTWLLAILNRKIIDYYRSKARSIVQHEISTGYGNIVEKSDELFDQKGGWKSYKSANWEATEPHLLDSPEFIRVFKECLAKLPERWQSSVKAKYILEKDSKAICKELDITPSNYWQILHRSKLLLKQCIENNWFKQ
ncbi:MAG: sigma-70 family RNA polymerase sigma factor [Bacteroidia bacterium]|jgi:RNA polymerase sigma-70 factor (ECF subfamily)|nr:sigma-70 family RNA polymerase sigma factor [Bacteroidia bacterium]